MDKIEEKEEWRAVNVPGFEGCYEISSIGRLRSVDRFVKSSHGSKQFRPSIIRPPKLYNGYYTYELSKNGLNKKFFAHRLVAIGFITKPEGKNHVNHKNCNKIDNRVSNLEWCTPKENTHHAILNGRVDRMKQSRKVAKLSKSEVMKVYELLRNGNTIISVHKKTGISKFIIHSIAHNQVKAYSEMLRKPVEYKRKTKLTHELVNEFLTSSLTPMILSRKYGIDCSIIYRIRKGYLPNHLSPIKTS